MTKFHHGHPRIICIVALNIGPLIEQIDGFYVGMTNTPPVTVAASPDERDAALMCYHRAAEVVRYLRGLGYTCHYRPVNPLELPFIWDVNLPPSSAPDSFTYGAS